MSAHMRLVAAVLLALISGGCDRVARTLDLTGNVPVVAPQLIGPERLRVTIPATGAQAVLGPVSRRGDVTVWTTRDGITLSLQEGMLIGTRGLGDDLMTADVTGLLALVRGRAGEGPVPHIRSRLDGEDRTVFRSYQCKRDAVTRDADLRRVEVLCISPLDRFSNIYWLTDTGAMARSRQWISPRLGHMETTLVSR